MSTHPKHTNLTHARAALEFVRIQMTKGAVNKVSDRRRFVAGSHPRSPIPRIEEMEETWRMMREDIGGGAGASLTLSDTVRRASQLSKNLGIGNCGEQAAIAFEYLSQRTTIPVTLASLGENHWCVLIDCDLQTKKNISVTSSRFAAFDLGPDCVVCDPWAEQYFAVADEWGSKMPGILASTTDLEYAAVPTTPLLVARGSTWGSPSKLASRAPGSSSGSPGAGGAGSAGSASS